MVLPPGISFRSSRATDANDDLGCLGGYHVQYEINYTIVNIVILPLQSVVINPLPEEERLLAKLDEAAIISDDEDDFISIGRMIRLDQIENEIREWIESKCESTLLELLRSTESRPGKVETTLKTLLSPNIVNLQLKTVAGDVTVVRYDGVPPWPKDWDLGTPLGITVELPIEAGVRRYDASEIVIVKRLAVPIVKIKHDDMELRCKLNINERSTQREYHIYQNLSRINADHELRVPAFHGCVIDGADSGVVALLIENTQVRFTTLDHAMGRSADIEPNDFDISQAGIDPSEWDLRPTRQRGPLLPSLERRRKWVRQLKQTMQALHENDIVWGDVKPANVVIDVNDDAWVINFGGGFTLPWKTASDADSMLGGLNALRLIEEYLETGKDPPMPEESCGRINGVKIEESIEHSSQTGFQGSKTNEEEKSYGVKRKSPSNPADLIQPRRKIDPFKRESMLH